MSPSPRSSAISTTLLGLTALPPLSPLPVPRQECNLYPLDLTHPHTRPVRLAPAHALPPFPHTCSLRSAPNANVPRQECNLYPPDLTYPHTRLVRLVPTHALPPFPPYLLVAIRTKCQRPLSRSPPIAFPPASFIFATTGPSPNSPHPWGDLIPHCLGTVPTLALFILKFSTAVNCAVLRPTLVRHTRAIRTPEQLC